MKNEWQRGQKVDSTTKRKYNNTSKFKKQKEIYKTSQIDNNKKTDKDIIFDETTFPELGSVEKFKPLDNKYVNICKNVINTNNDDKLKPGWIEFRKKNNCYEYSRDGEKYYPSHLYYNEKLIKSEEEINQEEMIQWNKTVEYLTDIYEKRSQEHYEIYYELDGYALAKIEREKYEKYAEQFEIEEEEEEEELEDDEYYSDTSIA